MRNPILILPLGGNNVIEKRLVAWLNDVRNVRGVYEGADYLLVRHRKYEEGSRDHSSHAEKWRRKFDIEKYGRSYA